MTHSNTVKRLQIANRGEETRRASSNSAFSAQCEEPS